MKFEASKVTLLDALQTAQNAIPSKTTLQILNNFLFKLKGNNLEITATDLDLTIVINIEVQGNGDGNIVINAKKFLEVTKELPDLPVICHVDDYVMTIKSETGFQCNITGFDASEYPVLPKSQESAQFEISKHDLKTLFEKTSFAVSNDVTTRVSLTGVFWQSVNDQIIMVGTDGHRLGKSWIKGTGPGLTKGIILPPKAVSQVLKTSHEESDQIKIEVGEANIKFISDKITLFSKLIEGPYPDYEKVIPADLSKVVKIKKEELINVLKRVATMAHTKTKQVKFSFSSGQLLLSAKNQDLGGDSEESLDIEYKGKEIAIGFNAHYVLEVLRLIQSEEILIKLNSNLGATVFEPNMTEKNYFFIVMPLRLLGDD